MKSHPAFLVDRLLQARAAGGRTVRPLIVAGAGVTMSATPGDPANSWAGLVQQAFAHIACHQKSAPERLRLEGLAKASITTRDAEALLDLCDEACGAFKRAGVDVSVWIYDELDRLRRNAEQSFRDGAVTPSVLTTIRHWQSDVRAIVATTNYDALLTMAGCGAPIALHERPLEGDAQAALEAALADARNVIHLHGRADKTNSAVFSRADYRALMELNTAPDSFARRIFDNTLPIFVGCGAGLFDPDISRLLEQRAAGEDLALRRSIVLHKAGDELELMAKRAPFDRTCELIAYGETYEDLAPFLDDVRQGLMAAGYGAPIHRSTSIGAQHWFDRRNAALRDAPLTAPIPPLLLDQEVRSLPVRRFYGSLLRAQVPHSEFNISEALHASLDSAAAVHDDARFDRVSVKSLAASPLSVILGDGGSGKTCFLKLIQNETLNKSPAILPLYVRAADYIRANTRSRLDLWSFLIEEARAPFDETELRAPPAEDIEDALLAAAARSQVLLLIDGLDEIAHVEDRVTVSSELIRLHERLQQRSETSRKYGFNRIVIASRSSGYRAAPISHPDVQHFVLGPLDPSEANRFHNHLYANLIVQRPQTRAMLRASRRALREALAPHADGLARSIDSPLMGVLVAIAFLSDGTLPKSRQGLYQRILDLSCDWTLARASSPPPSITRDNLETLLQEAAYRTFQSRSHDIVPESAIRDAIQDVFADFEGDVVRRVIELVRSDESLLRERSPGQYGFVHRGVLEFLCGLRLHRDLETAVAKTLEPGWRETASFALAAALQREDPMRVGALVAQRCSPANGGRPLVCLLRAADYAETLSAEACVAIACATIDVLAPLSELLHAVRDHAELHSRLVRLKARPGVASAFALAVTSELADEGACAERYEACLILIECLLEPSAELIAAIDVRSKRFDQRTRLRAESVLRRMLSLHVARTPDAPGALAFARELSIHHELLAQSPPWRRALMALSGGVLDFQTPEDQRQYKMLASFLAVEDARRNVLLFTLAEDLRTIALSQADLIVAHRLTRPDRPLSEREAKREQRRRPDLVMGLATFLDTYDKAGKAERLKIDPEFNLRAIYRTPLVASLALQTLSAGQAPDALVSKAKARAETQEEGALINAALGLAYEREDLSPGALERAAAGLADAALRSLLSVERATTSLGADISDDVAYFFADAIIALRFSFGLESETGIGTGDAREDFVQLRVADRVARALSGEDNSDAVYNAMVWIDTLSAQKRTGALMTVSRSRVCARGEGQWDLAPLPLHHLHTRPQDILGEVIDVLEACPPNISAMRYDTLRGLRQIAVESNDPAELEFDASLACDWGSQAWDGAGEKIEAPSWQDACALAHARAAAAPVSIWSVRALIRLLRWDSGRPRTEREGDIRARIDAIEDAFDRVLALELLATHAGPGASSQFAAEAAAILLRIQSGRESTAEPSVASEPERFARAFVRLSVWLPAQKRCEALQAGARLAQAVEGLLPRTLLLQAILPYVRRDPVALALWQSATDNLAPYYRDFASDQPGKIIARLSDQHLAAQDRETARRADALVAYALLRDARRAAGDELDAFEVLERAPVTADGAERVRAAFTSSRPPRLSAAGLVSLRTFGEAGCASIVELVMTRVPRHPPGSAALLADFGYERLALIVQATQQGLSPASAAPVVETLSSTIETERALSSAILAAPPLAPFGDANEGKNYRVFTLRRANIAGLSTLLELSRAAAGLDWVGHSQQIAHFLNDFLFETPDQARAILSGANSPGAAGACAFLLRSATAATPHFLETLLREAQGENRTRALALTARALHRCPPLSPALLKNNGFAHAREIMLNDRRTAARVFAAQPADAVALLERAAPLDAASMNSVFVAQNRKTDLSDEGLPKTLAAWGAGFFANHRIEGTAAMREAATALSSSEAALAALVRYCAYDATELGAPLDETVRRGLTDYAWPLLAACAERTPQVIKQKMQIAGLFENLPAFASRAPEFPARRAAFLLMPLEWQGQERRTNLDILEASLKAAEDVWAVQEAALFMAGSIRRLDEGALELLVARAEHSSINTLMAFRILFAIHANDQAPSSLRKHAQDLISKAMTSEAADRLIYHSLVTAGSPPRMRLKELLAREVFSSMPA